MNRKERNSNMELLRIIAMLMIVCGHIFKFWKSDYIGMPEYDLMPDSFFLTNQGVDIFILISGYFGIRSTVKKYVFLWTSIIFYSIVSAVICLISGAVSMENALLWPIKEFFIATSYLWYVQTYFALLLFAPFINNLFLESKAKQLIYLIVFLVLDVVFQTNKDGFFGMSLMGGALLHFITLYILARIVSLWQLHLKLRFSVIAYIIVVIVSFLCWGKSYYSGADTSIWVVLPSILLLMIFREINFSNKYLNVISSASFAVYCIHARCSTLVASICSPLLTTVYHFNSLATYPLVVSLSVCIYLCIMPIELIKDKMMIYINPVIEEKIYNKYIFIKKILH